MSERRLISPVPITNGIAAYVAENAYLNDTALDALKMVAKWIDEAPTVDAVPVDEIRLHHILIDNEGVPETKIQIGDRYFILRTDPVDARRVVHGRWVDLGKNYYTVVSQCSECGSKYNFRSPYCPQCGAKMDGDENA